MGDECVTCRTLSGEHETYFNRRVAMPEKFHSVLQSRAIISDANGTVALMSQNQGGNQMIC